jgi:hypothetical protein
MVSSILQSLLLLLLLLLLFVFQEWIPLLWLHWLSMAFFRCLLIACQHG